MDKGRVWRVCALALTVGVMAGACGDDGGSASVPTTVAGDDGVAPAPSAPTTTADAPAPSRFVAAAVERTDDGMLRITWELDGDDEVEVSWGPDPDAPDESIRTVSGASELLIEDPSGGLRPYFRLATEDDTVTVAERRILLEGQPNFRDLGGYETTDGRRVRWGRIFRSGELGELTADDLDLVSGVLGIRLVCDLRSPGEVAELPDPALGSAERIEIPIYDTSVDPVEIEQGILAGDLAVADPQLLIDGNRAFVTDFGQEYGDLLRRVMDPASWPTNLHCTAGKDRAGWGAAMILLALGVPRQTVMEDYLLSEVYRAEENEATVATVRTVVAAIRGVTPEEIPDEELDGLRALIGVRAEFLQAAFDALDEEFGDVDTYLTEGLGVTPAELEAFRDAMLE
jgi:protein-tyrosine phosphatase